MVSSENVHLPQLSPEAVRDPSRRILLNTELIQKKKNSLNDCVFRYREVYDFKSNVIVIPNQAKSTHTHTQKKNPEANFPVKKYENLM